MRPDVTEQLAGIRKVLEDVVAPHVTDPYPADVLDGALATLEMLADTWAEVPAFLRWDAAETTAVLRQIGVDAPAPPEDPLDLAALHEHDRAVRELLEQHIDEVLSDEAARTATVALFRERAVRYPLATRPRGGFGAHAAR